MLSEQQRYPNLPSCRHALLHGSVQAEANSLASIATPPPPRGSTGAIVHVFPCCPTVRHTSCSQKITFLSLFKPSPVILLSLKAQKVVTRQEKGRVLWSPRRLCPRLQHPLNHRNLHHVKLYLIKHAHQQMELHRKVTFSFLLR